MDHHFWKNKYEQKATGWDLGTISPPLKAYFDQLTSKTAAILIPGCGFGHEAIYLSEQGFTDITVIDLIPEALEQLKADHPNINAITGDFFALQGSYDLIIEQTLFCAIDPTRRQEYTDQVANLLHPGGKYVGVLFNREFEGGPPFGGNIEEYITYFYTSFSDYSIEMCYNSAPPRAGSEVFIRAIR
jgi:SAM-dependent methyltransferase